MSRREWSLRGRLLVWLLTPLILLGAFLLVDGFRGARGAVDRAYDALIAASALAIADRVVVTDGTLDIDLPYVALEMLASQADDRVFYRISDPRGHFVTGYRDLPQPVDDAPANPWFYDSSYRGDEVRVVQLTQPISGQGMAGEFTVEVAQTRGERDLLARELATGTAIRLMVMILLVALVTWFGIRVGLEPLKELRTQIRRRSPHDLRPLNVDVPREVRDVVGAVDTLMTRLASSLASMERFIADAAHQLRTPLSALQTQVETALRSNEPSSLRSSVERLQAITWRTSRLATQLLSHARSTADTATLTMAPVALGELAADVARSRVPAALRKYIDLGFEGDDAETAIRGDEILLREGIGNLVDNALKYCPAKAHVTVRIRRRDDLGCVIVEVEDDGPGIPVQERHRVLERFYRVPGTGQEGSGLGLSIVSAVAERHGGTVSLHDGTDGGLLVRVRFPAAK